MAHKTIGLLIVLILGGLFVMTHIMSLIFVALVGCGVLYLHHAFTR